MGFLDMPQIDASSKNSDASTVKLRTYINQQNGFIAREDVPDKGCDFDVELILDGRDVSGWRFALQLKSVQKLKLVDNDSFVSFSFETSRLGYLLRRIPGMGILALYSVENDCIYYDLVENIYERICNEREDDEWKSQHTVTVKFPVDNLLNDQSVATLHGVFLKRFERAAVMLKSHGPSYNLPVVDLGISKEYDFNNPADIARALKKIGVALLSSYDLEMVYSLVSKLTTPQINAAKELQIIAAIAYCEAGKHADAGYYFDRLKRRTDIEEYECQMIDFGRLKNDVALGRIEWKDFYESCKALQSVEGDTLNDITLTINLDYFRIQNIRPLEEVPMTLLGDIQNNFAKIDAAKGDAKTKALLEIWNADNLSMVMGCLRSHALGKARARESIGLQLSSTERREAAQLQVTLETLLHLRLDQLRKQAEKDNNKVMYANIILTYNRNRLSREIDLIAYEYTENKEHRAESLEQHIQQAQMGAQIFIDSNRFKEAYHSLCHAIEFIILAREYFGLEDQNDLERLLGIQRQLEGELEFPQYESAIKKLLANKRMQVELKDGERQYGDMSDAEIDYTAALVLQGMQLPKERLQYIVKEMKDYRLFYQRCKDPNLELLVYDPYRTQENRYAAPVRMVIRSRASGLQTQPSSDMEVLLSYWRL